MKSPMVASPLHGALIALLAAAVAVTPSFAAQCASYGINAPEVPTLMASKTNPARQAWVVTPDCGVEVIDLMTTPEGAVKLDPPNSWEERDLFVKRIASLPSDLTELELWYFRAVTSIDASSASVLKSIFMIVATSPKLDLVLPKSLETFLYWEGSLETLDNVDFPAGVTSITVKECRIRSLRNVKWPAALKTLGLTRNRITSIDFSLPSRLDALYLSSNPIATLETLELPPSVTVFCGLGSIQGVRWPTSLRTLNVGENPMASIEIRQSDVRTFESLTEFKASVTQTTCVNAQAKTIKGVPVCVIDDDVFESLYPLRTNSPGVTSAPTESSSRSGSQGSSSSSSSSSDSPSFTESNSGGGGNTTTGTGGASTTDRSGQRVPIDGDSDGTDTAQGSSSSMSATLLLVIGGVGSLLAVLVATIGYRVCVTKRRRESDSTKYYGEAISTPLGEDPTIHESSTQEYLSNDVRNDKALLPFRIERRDVQLGKVIARGGYGLVYRGRYDGRDVAIKQMLPNAVRDDAMLASFMDEIRLCASLDHPKIVQFVGITWSSLRDLSVLTEFMAGGDLYELLYQPSNRPHPDHWRQSWSTKTVANLPCKLQMALDVAEAVVYLHSFASPIIHRDLKSKNVLMDTRGHPKLSDFGISRELAVDETMTSEVGTSAWIAPEVLRGERYSEQADVYSLGVVLVELDRCCHPYAGEPALQQPQPQPHQPQPYPQSSVAVNSTQSFASRSAQIAVLVSTGRLRPSLSADAPREVKELVGRCLANRPEERVNSMEVCYELRQLLKRRV